MPDQVTSDCNQSGTPALAPASCSADRTDRQRVDDAWRQVLALGEKLSQLLREKRDLMLDIRDAVEAAERIEKETGLKW